MAQLGTGQGVSGESLRAGASLSRLRQLGLFTWILHLHRKFPQTATEWAEILALQKHFHSVEVHKWRQILRASVELLDEVHGSHVGFRDKGQDAPLSGPVSSIVK